MYQPPAGPPPYGPSPHGPQGPQGPWPPPQQHGYPYQPGYPSSPGYPPYGPPPKKRGRGPLIIVSILVVGVIGFLALVGWGVSLANEPASDAERLKNAKDAQFITEYSTVCDRGSVSNAAAYEKPYTIVAFHQRDPGDDSYSDVTFDYDSPYNATRYPVTSVNVVACLSLQEGTEVKAKTCEYDEAIGKDEIDLYSVKYAIELREASTGKSIENLGLIDGPAGACPTFVFQPGSKLYADPDPKQLEGALDAFAER